MAPAHVLRPIQLRQLDPQRRHTGEAGDALPCALPDHVAGQQIVVQHHRRADVEAGGQLAEAGIEAEWQHRQDPVLRGILQILADADRAGDHVAMGEDHALRHAGAARGVEDRGDIQVDDTVAGAGRVRQHRRPVDKAGGARCSRRRAHVHDVGEAAALGKRRGQPHQAFGGGHKHAHFAVGQDVRHLLALEQRVDGHVYAAGARGAEHRNHRLEALLGVDGDALAAPQAQREQPGGKRLHGDVQRAVRQRVVPVLQRRALGVALRRLRDQLVDENVHGGLPGAVRPPNGLPRAWRRRRRPVSRASPACRR
jgi:hypothetical protein